MSNTPRTRRTADQWRQLIAEQSNSGMSQAAFCQHKQLALSTFANWKRRLAEGIVDIYGRLPYVNAVFSGAQAIACPQHRASAVVFAFLWISF